ncbi:MAG: CDP-diacylglycerol--glycerol-3-phosphate 3-phosphatidyltransferase [Clostridiales bacterium]|nr:CDP-diacylglycerol--glycerol-3-phosphate 3-phosphatidyltransferase [Clostridiales bacterium]
MNLPNKITLSRIFVVPLFMLFVIPIPSWVINLPVLTFMRGLMLVFNNFIMVYGNYIAAGIFIILASTDAVDGYIARKHKMVTKVGIFLDPIADKLLVTSALIALLERGELTGWAAMIIIGREFIVTGLRLVLAGEGVVVAASNWGKIKTITQMVAIVLALVKNYPLSMFTDFAFDRVAMFIAVIITIYSLYDYLKKNIHIITKPS